MTTWRVPIGGTRKFSTFERALRRARRFYVATKQPIEVLEVDANGNETPIARIPKAGSRK